MIWTTEKKECVKVEGKIGRKGGEMLGTEIQEQKPYTVYETGGLSVENYGNTGELIITDRDSGRSIRVRTSREGLLVLTQDGNMEIGAMCMGLPGVLLRKV